MNKYTPKTNDVRDAYEFCEITRSTERYLNCGPEPLPVVEYQKEFDRWLAQHEQQLREQIAQEIEAAPKWIPIDSNDVGYFAGLKDASRIVRKEQTNES